MDDAAVTTAAVTAGEVALLVHHYNVEVNRWAGESPAMEAIGAQQLAYWQAVKRAMETPGAQEV